MALAVTAVLAASSPAVAHHDGPTAAETAGQVLRIARAEVARDVREAPAGSDLGARIRMYGRSTTEIYYPAPWCSYFVSWVTRQAGIPIGHGGTGLARVADVATWAQETGRWRRVPRRADLMVFVGHIGIVDWVLPDGDVITIEGNHDDRLMRVRRGRSEALGFVRVTPHFLGR